jgi:hypothetical protein
LVLEALEERAGQGELEELVALEELAEQLALWFAPALAGLLLAGQPLALFELLERLEV